MKPTITRILPLYPKTNFVQWSLDDPDSIVSSFTLLRSGSPTGPFETVVSGLPPNTFFFNDDSPNPYGLTNRIWYQVQAVPLTGAINSVLSDAYAVSSNKYDAKNKILRKARRDLEVTLSKLSGVRVTILKRSVTERGARIATTRKLRMSLPRGVLLVTVLVTERATTKHFQRGLK